MFYEIKELSECLVLYFIPMAVKVEIHFCGSKKNDFYCSLNFKKPFWTFLKTGI